MNLKQYTIPKKVTRTYVEDMLFENFLAAFSSLLLSVAFALVGLLPLTFVMAVLGMGCTHNYHRWVEYSRKKGWVRE